MKKKQITMLLGSTALGLVLAAIPLMAACAKPAPAPPAPAPAPAPPEVINWKLATFASAKGTVAQTFKYWRDELSRRTNGRLKVKIYWSAELAADREMLDATKSGLCDVGHVCASYFPGRLPLTALSYLPAVYPPRADWECLAWDELAETFRPVQEEWDRYNMVYGCYFQSALMTFIGTKPIRNIDDLKGLKIRMTGAAGELLKKFGATPTHIPFPDSYTALDTGLIDVMNHSTSVLYRYKFYELSKYFTTGLNLSGAAAHQMINKDSWNALPDDIKRIIVDVRPEYGRFCHQFCYNPEEFKQAHDAFKARGIEFTEFPPEERAKMVEAASDIWEDWIREGAGEKGRQLVDAWFATLEKVKAKYPEGLPPYPVGSEPWKTLSET